MNIRAALLRSVLAIGFGAASAFAQDPFAKPLPTVLLTDQPQFAIDVLMVSVPQREALQLLPRLRDADRFAGAETELLRLIMVKQAQLISWPELIFHEGTTATSESAMEQRFPSAFEPPSEATLSGYPEPSLAAKIRNACAAAGMDVARGIETRQLHVRLEASATLSPDAHAATINVSLFSLQLHRYDRFPLTAPGVRPEYALAQPLFGGQHTNSTLTLRNNERRLIYVGKQSETPDRLSLFTMGLRIIPPLTAKN